MTILKVWNRESSFHVDSHKYNSKGEKLAVCKWKIYMEELTAVKIMYSWRDGEQNVKDTEQLALREHPKYGLMFWNPREQCWNPFREKYQEEYSNFVAERELLDK